MCVFVVCVFVVCVCGSVCICSVCICSVCVWEWGLGFASVLFVYGNVNGFLSVCVGVGVGGGVNLCCVHLCIC